MKAISVLLSVVIAVGFLEETTEMRIANSVSYEYSGDGNQSFSVGETGNVTLSYNYTGARTDIKRFTWTIPPSKDIAADPPDSTIPASPFYSASTDVARGFGSLSITGVKYSLNRTQYQCIVLFQDRFALVESSPLATLTVKEIPLISAIKHYMELVEIGSRFQLRLNVTGEKRVTFINDLTCSPGNGQQEYECTLSRNSVSSAGQYSVLAENDFGFHRIDLNFQVFYLNETDAECTLWANRTNFDQNPVIQCSIESYPGLTEASLTCHFGNKTVQLSKRFSRSISGIERYEIAYQFVGVNISRNSTFQCPWNFSNSLVARSRNFTIAASTPSQSTSSSLSPSARFPSTSSPSASSPSTSSSFDFIRNVIVPVAICFGVFVLLLFVFLCIRLKRAKQANVEHHLELPTYHPPHVSRDYYSSEPPDQWEIARDALKLLEVLGRGFFGIVLKGNLNNNFLCLSRSMPSFRRKQKDRCIARTVACKMLKESATEENQKELLEEIKLMKRIGEHQHIVSMVGCITRSQPTCLVVEYCSGGDLLGYLKKGRKPYVKAIGSPLSELENRLPRGVADVSKKATSSLDEKGLLSSAPNEQRDDGVLTPEELMSFSWQISSGMDYLSGKGLVHRDLACRNVLVVKEKLLKVSDFGLTRAVYQDGKYAQKTTRHLPLRWMPIEAILDREFSEKSDIWSFGIVIWEICTLGCFPYPLMSTEDFLHFLRKGNRLNRPENCSEELYSVMLQCWEAEPNRRPCFRDVEKQLREIMDSQSPSSYVKFDFSNMIAIWKAADSVEEKQERDGDSVQEVDEVDETERDQSDTLDN